ncbi:HEAT repeat domain-containing protein [Halocatena halophila]|uniref:HEAT repeat domain-containing protein n=1 Tax=Halocatena halophila TaxID=2814576 RepID=UPI002ED3A59C
MTEDTDVQTGDTVDEPIEIERLREDFEMASSNRRRELLSRCVTIAESAPRTLTPMVETIAECLCSSSVVNRQETLSVLERLVEEDVAPIIEVRDCLLECVDTEYGAIQMRAAKILAVIASEQPDSIESDVPKLLSVVAQRTPYEPSVAESTLADPITQRTIEHHELDERKDGVMGRRLLVGIVRTVLTETSTTLTDESITTLETLITDDDPVIAGDGAYCLGEIAANGGTIGPSIVRTLIEQLEHHDTAVRSQVIWALGHAGAPAAIAPLARLADEDPNGEIRSMAADTVSFLQASERS